jgi:putative transposase
MQKPFTSARGVTRWAHRALARLVLAVQQFTTQEFTSILERAGDRICMDGRLRALGRAGVERLRRKRKYEDVHAMDCTYLRDLRAGLQSYLWVYIRGRPGWSLGYRAAPEVHYA